MRRTIGSLAILGAIIAMGTFVYRQIPSSTGETQIPSSTGETQIPSSTGETYNVFVDVVGSDTGSNCVRFATPIEPPADATTYCRTPDAAYHVAAAGDLVRVSGTYGGSGVIFAFTPDASKTSALDVVFRGADRSTLLSSIQFNGGDHITLENFTACCNIATQTNGAGDRSEDITVKDFDSTGTTRLYTQGSKDVRYQDGSADARNQKGVSGSITTEGGFRPTNITFDGIYFYGPSNPEHEADCLHAFDYDGLIIRNSYFEHCNSYAILLNKNPSPRGPVLIESNVFNDSANHAIFLGCCIEHQNYTIRFNSARRGISISRVDTTFSGTLEVHGNVVQSATCLGAWTFTSNVYHGTSTMCDASDSPSSPATEFVDHLNGDLHLAAGAVAIGHADGSVSFPALDRDDNPRPLGLLDAGAYERR